MSDNPVCTTELIDALGQLKDTMIRCVHRFARFQVAIQDLFIQFRQNPELFPDDIFDEIWILGAEHANEMVFVYTSEDLANVEFVKKFNRHMTEFADQLDNMLNEIDDENNGNDAATPNLNV